LQQGRADSFTMMTPKERKGVLKEILNLSDWGIYEDRAKKKRDAIGRDRSLIEMKIGELKEDVAQEPIRRQKLEEACQVVERAASIKQDAEAQYESVKGARERMEANSAAIGIASTRQRNRERDLTELQTQIESKQSAVQYAQERVDKKEEIAANFAALQAAKRNEKDFNKQYREYVQTEKRLDKLRGELEKQVSSLEHEAEALRKAILKLEKDALQIDALTESVQLRTDKLTGLLQKRSDRDNLHEKVAALDEANARLKAELQSHTKERDVLRKRYAVLKTDTQDAACPVCGSPLDEVHRQELVEEAHIEGDKCNDAITQTEQALRDIANRRQEHDTKRKTFENELRGIDSLQAEIGQYQAKHQAAIRNYDEAQQIRAELGRLEQILMAEDFAPEIRASIAQTENELVSLGYDRAAYDEVQDTLHRLQDYDGYQREVERAEEQLPGLYKEVSEAQDRLTRWTSDVESDRSEVARLNAERKHLEKQVLEEELRRVELRAAQKTFVAADDELKRAEMNLSALEAARIRLKEKLVEHDKLSYEHKLYEKLVKAFGQNGVPAMIIESAIPDLEREANAILSLISEGRMKVQFQMQKETKSGTVADTLDLLISDELGTRDYSLYSGGEAFRVNFAVRVALSKFLSRRSGSQLRTLFIDEGFGSQDTSGRERLIEAINRISNQFDLILVVTHVDELQDAFQKHLRVTKVRDGGASVQLTVD